MFTYLYSLLLAALIPSLILAQDLTLTTTNALTFTSSVNHVHKDWFGDYWVSLSNNTIIRYIWAFNQSYIWQLTYQPSRHILAYEISMSLSLNNGSTLRMFNQHSAVVDMTNTTIEVYTYPERTFQEQHTFSRSFIQVEVRSCPVGSYQPTYALGLLDNGVELSFEGQMHSKSYELSSGHVINIQKIKAVISTGSDTLYRRQTYFASLDDFSVYKIDVKLAVLFNHTTQRFDLLPGQFIVALTLVVNPSSAITTMQAAGDLVYMQNSAATEAYVYNLDTGASQSVSPVQSGRSVSQIVETNGEYYALFSDGLAKLSVSAGSNSVSMNYNTSSFSSGNYELAVTSNSSALYEPGSSTVFIPYTPPVSNTTTANSTNSTTTSSANSTVVPTISPVYSGQKRNSAVQVFIDILTGTFQSAISVPSGRRFLSPLFKFFGIFDDMFLFQYHDRLYGNTMNAVFKQVNEVEETKWSLVDYKQALSAMGVDVDGYEKIAEYQISYQTYNFTTPNHTEVGSESLVANCHNFFVVSLPVTLIVFTIFKAVFRLLYKYPLSMVLRKFDFMAFLFILLFDGNVQQFAFYTASQMQTIFFFAMTHKIVKSFLLLFGCFLVLGSVSLYFLCYHLYGKLNRVLMDNNKNVMGGHVFLIVQLGFRNLLLGFMHSFLRQMQYELMLGLIVAVDCVFLSLFIVSINGDLYKRNSKIWIYVLLNFIKIVLVATLFVDYKNTGHQLIEDIQQFILFLQIGLFVCGTMVETIDNLIDVVRLIMSIYRAGSEGESYTPFMMINDQDKKEQEDRKKREAARKKQKLKQGKGALRVIRHQRGRKVLNNSKAKPQFQYFKVDNNVRVPIDDLMRQSGSSEKSKTHKLENIRKNVPSVESPRRSSQFRPKADKVIRSMIRTKKAW